MDASRRNIRISGRGIKGLPEVCRYCHQLKLPHLGKRRPGFKYNTFHFVCFDCLEKPRVQRQLRPNNETPPEREVRLWLQEQGIAATAEYPVGPFIYDFALTKLGLLVELDSKRYHSAAKHRIHDAKKTRNAISHGWILKRVQVSPNMTLDIEREIIARNVALGHIS